MGGARIFSRISPNLFDFSLQIFPHKDHKDLFWCDVQKKRSCVFLWFWRIEVKGLGAIWSGFSTNHNFCGCACTPRLLHHCYSCCVQWQKNAEEQRPLIIYVFKAPGKHLVLIRTASVLRDMLFFIKA